MTLNHDWEIVYDCYFTSPQDVNIVQQGLMVIYPVKVKLCAVVVLQFGEWSLPTLEEDRGLNPAIGSFNTYSFSSKWIKRLKK